MVYKNNKLLNASTSLHDDQFVKKGDDFISRESLQLFEAMDQGQKLADSIEFAFASQFENLDEMSSMVAMTAGAYAHDIGINKYELASEVTKSLNS